MSATRKEKLRQLLYCDRCRSSKNRLCTKKYDCGDSKYDCIRCTENSMCDDCVLCRTCVVKFNQCKACGQPITFGSENKEIVMVLNEIKTAIEDIHGFFVHAAVGDQLNLATIK